VSSILVFTEVYKRGGGNRYMVDMVNALGESYGDIVIVGNSGALYPEDERRLRRPYVWRPVHFITRIRLVNSIRMLPLPLSYVFSFLLVFIEPLFFLYNVATFCLLLKRVVPSHVLSCNGGYPAASACLALVVAAGLMRIPVALSVVSVPSRRRLFLRHLLHAYDSFIDKLVVRFVSVVIVNSQAIATPLQLLHGMPTYKILLVHNGLEERVPSEGLAKMDGELIIGCIARMDVAKGVLVLLDAFEELVASRPGLKLVLAGQGDASKELARRVKSSGLEGRVDLLGHFDGNVDTLIRTFDLFVFPSFWEGGLPFSIIEAMRASTAIVMTTVGGIPEVINNEEEGLLVPPGSSHALVTAISRLLDDSVLRQKLSSNARLKYEKSFSLEKMQQCVRDGLKAKLF
jgi:glycosyltransferase involved in cell wall biosynthesis